MFIYGSFSLQVTTKACLFFSDSSAYLAIYLILHFTLYLIRQISKSMKFDNFLFQVSIRKVVLMDFLGAQIAIPPSKLQNYNCSLIHLF